MRSCTWYCRYVFSFLLPYAGSVQQIRRAWLSRGIGYISRISYSLYLVPYSLVFIPFFSFLNIEDPLQAGALYLLYWVIILVLSGLLYRYFELPVMKLRERFSKDQSAHT
jgi:peptidoglycan/LPS O-acetylase OafA/YrhL